MPLLLPCYFFYSFYCCLSITSCFMYFLLLYFMFVTVIPASVFHQLCSCLFCLKVFPFQLILQTAVRFIFLRHCFCLLLPQSRICSDSLLPFHKIQNFQPLVINYSFVNSYFLCSFFCFEICYVIFSHSHFCFFFHFPTDKT